MKKAVCCGLVCVFGVLTAFPVVSQVKIEEQLAKDVLMAERVRVLIVTRPEIGASNPQAASIQTLTSSLGAESEVRAIGDLPVATAEISAEQLDILREDPNVALVVRDVAVPPILFESGPLIGATQAHSKGVTGAGVAVAILDTGVQADHPALTGTVVQEACFSTRRSPDGPLESLCPGGYETSLVKGAASKCPPSVPGCEHGTHVAGIVAGHQMSFAQKQFEGISPGAKIIAVQVFTLFKDRTRCGGRASCVLSYTSDQLRALEWIYKQRDKYQIAAVNMSLGGGYFDSYCDGGSALTEVIERLRSKGIATVIAAGNEGFYDGTAQPACISSAISVSALNKQRELDVSYSNVSKLVDISAPGTDITSAVLAGHYQSLSGTSMAAPHVAAAFALLRQKYPNETVKQLENRLVENAKYASDPRTDTRLPVLELTHALEVPTSKQASTAPVSGTSQTDLTTNSFIVRSDVSSDQIQTAVENKCPDLNCEVKQIGNNTFKIDVHELSGEGILGRENSQTKRIQEIMKDLDPSAKVFDNRLSAPLQ